MSTQLRFDLAGLVEAIECGDLDYQLDLYSADAQLRVADADPRRPLAIYQGKDEIRGRLEGLDLQHACHRLVDLRSTRHELALTYRMRHPDGKHLLCRTSLQLDRGQVVSQTVSLTGDDRHSTSHHSSQQHRAGPRRSAEPPAAPQRRGAPGQR